MSRRATKAPQRSTHLDLVDNDNGDIKIHNKRRANNTKANIARAIFCAVAALTTLYCVSTGKVTFKRIMSRTPSKKEQDLSQQQINLPPDSIYRTKVEDIHGEWRRLMDYAGNVSLVVNVACEWGLTQSNYKELAILHERYKSRGFNVLAFPTNDFQQEKETNEEILDYVTSNFPEVHFPLFSKAPLATNMVFQLCQKQTYVGPTWNL